MGDVVTNYRLKEAKRNSRRECAELVYHYPTFSLEDAEQMPLGDRKLLLVYARLHRAELMLELSTILAAVQSKAGFQKKLSQLEGVIKELSGQL